jgi:hypothetical protein
MATKQRYLAWTTQNPTGQVVIRWYDRSTEARFTRARQEKMRRLIAQWELEDKWTEPERPEKPSPTATQPEPER